MLLMLLRYFSLVNLIFFFTRNEFQDSVVSLQNFFTFTVAFSLFISKIFFIMTSKMMCHNIKYCFIILYFIITSPTSPTY